MTRPRYPTRHWRRPDPQAHRRLRRTTLRGFVHGGLAWLIAWQVYHGHTGWQTWTLAVTILAFAWTLPTDTGLPAR